MPRDRLDALIDDMRRLDGAAIVGALDEKTARLLRFAEFGTATAPPRPTLSTTTDRLTPAIFRTVQSKVAAAIEGKHTTGQEIVADVGRDLAEAVREQIDGNTPPELAESTKRSRRRRGKDLRTLVDSGDMMRGIGMLSSADPDAFRDE